MICIHLLKLNFNFDMFLIFLAMSHMTARYIDMFQLAYKSMETIFNFYSLKHLKFED